MRVLVVEDDELLASSLRRGLTAEGYAVEVAASTACTWPGSSIPTR